MISWTTVEDALHAWAVAGSGLSAAQVIWAQQKAPRPSGAYLAMRVTSVRRLGQDWTVSEDADEPEDGAELTVTARGPREMTLGLQCFAGVDGAGTGATMPAARLNNIISAARLPTRRVALNVAGVGVGGFGPVQSIDGVLGASVFEPRATLEARLFLADEVSETGSYIQYFNGTDAALGVDFWVPEEPA